MKDHTTKRNAPAQLKPDRSTLFIVLSLAEIAIAGPFAVIPLMWSIAYRKEVKTDPGSHLRKTAKTAVLATGIIGIALALLIAFLYLLTMSL